MSLCKHVANKDDILDRLVELVVALLAKRKVRFAQGGRKRLGRHNCSMVR